VRGRNGDEDGTKTAETADVCFPLGGWCTAVAVVVAAAMQLEASMCTTK